MTTIVELNIRGNIHFINNNTLEQYLMITLKYMNKAL